MEDLISREEAIKSIIDNSGFGSQEEAERASQGYGDEEAIATTEAIEAIKRVPSVNAKRVKGKWIYLDTPTVHGKCSCCGFEAHYYEDDVYGYDYCPNCGARLRGNDT